MKLILIMLMALMPFSVFAGQNYGDAIVYRLVSVYDGDTIKVDIDGMPAIIGEAVSIRVYGIDTPEMRGGTYLTKLKAKKARDFLYKRLMKAEVIELVDMSRGKSFRIVAKVYIDGTDIGPEMIKRGLAKPYYGGKKIAWE